MYHRRHKTTQLGAPFAVVIGPIVQYANRTPVWKRGRKGAAVYSRWICACTKQRTE